MLDINYISENRARVLEGLEKKNFKQPELVDQVLNMNDTRKKLKFELDNILQESNSLAKEIGQLFGQGKRDEAEAAKQKATDLRDQSKAQQEELHKVEAQLHELLIQLPNLPDAEVPAGTTPEDNKVVKEWGEKPQLPEGAKPHWELMEEYNLISLELGNKITGSGFPVYTGAGAKLQRGLINFFLDKAIEEGYQEYIPPYLVNEDTAYGTGQLPDKEGQMYHARDDNFYLIPTAEVPLTNVYRDTILKEEDFPVKMTGHSPCFRREAGSYGKDVRGLNRVHQFDKVEIVQIQHPDKSYDTLSEMVNYVGGLLEQLQLPYRILLLCGGDTSFTAAKTYDFEVWSAAQERWLEVSSVSNFESFQANRMKLRYKGEDKKTHLAHTLNGSALALPRIVATILENNQTGDGISIPEVLVPYIKMNKIG